jgi:hypothetical protein
LNVPPPSAKVLYIIACAAPPTRHVSTLVTMAQADGWDVCVITTPQGTAFMDIPAVETLTGHVVRSQYKQPHEADALPPPTAIIVSPATFNTINKWAAGISDTLALGLLTEAIGKHVPTIAVPYTNRAHAAHPAFEQSIQHLRSWGVTVLYGNDVYPLHEPGTGTQNLHRYPWNLTLQTLNNLNTPKPQEHP